MTETESNGAAPMGGSDAEVGTVVAPKRRNRRGSGRRNGRPTREEQRQRAVAVALDKFHDVLPNLLVEVAELAGASSTKPAVRVQLLQSLDRLIALLPGESRPKSLPVLADGFDWGALHAEALAIIERDHNERDALRARIAELEGRGPTTIRHDVAVAPAIAAPQEEVVVRPPEVVPQEPLTAANAVPDSAGRYPPLPLSEINKLIEMGKLPSNHNCVPWRRKIH